MEMESVFSKTLGNNPTLRILDFLITGEDFDYSVSDIEKGSETSRVKVYEIIKSLEKEGIVRKTRTVANAPLYRLNKNSKKAKILIDFYNQILNDFDEE